MIDQSQVKKIVHEVLSEVLKSPEGLDRIFSSGSSSGSGSDSGSGTKAGSIHEAGSGDHGSSKARTRSAAGPDSETRPGSKAGVPGRRLAEENIARWLGHAPGFRQKAERQHRLPDFKPLGKIPGDENREYPHPEDPRGYIPKPRKPEGLEKIMDTTPARIGVWRAGTRYLTKVALKLRADHAVAKDAVAAELPANFAESHGWIPLETKAKSKEEFLLRPDLGRQLDEKSLKAVQEKGIRNPDIQITVADGLSAWAAERYAAPMVAELVKLCKEKNYSVGTIFCVRYSRIAIQDVVGETVNAKISIILLGERPGLGSGDSLSNYMVYGPKVGIVNAKKSMISNIHPVGHRPEDAARLTMQMFEKMFEQKCSGVELKV